MRKNLVNSKKSSTFAPAFSSGVTYDEFIAPRIVLSCSSREGAIV